MSQVVGVAAERGAMLGWGECPGAGVLGCWLWYDNISPLQALVAPTHEGVRISRGLSRCLKGPFRRRSAQILIGPGFCRQIVGEPVYSQ
jgi:hypothetical protein